MNEIYAFVLNTEIKTSKGGKDYLSMELRSELGKVRCNMWSFDRDNHPEEGQYIVILNYEDKRKDYNNIVCNQYEVVDESKVPDSVKPLCAKTEEVEDAWVHITDDSYFENIRYRDFVNDCMIAFGDANFIKKAASAESVHHHYQGGHVIHTSEVLSLCQAMVSASERYKFINSDVLYAAAILHDMGKCITYYINDKGNSAKHVEEKIIGHLFYGMHFVANIAKEKGYEDLEVNEILHLIGSHHGNPEWGAIKVPMTIEAVMLHSADYISSRNGLVDTYLKANTKLPEQFTVYGATYYVTSGMKSYNQCTMIVNEEEQEDSK